MDAHPNTQWRIEKVIDCWSSMMMMMMMIMLRQTIMVMIMMMMMITTIWEHDVYSHILWLNKYQSWQSDGDCEEKAKNELSIISINELWWTQESTQILDAHICYLFVFGWFWFAFVLFAFVWSNYTFFASFNWLWRWCLRWDGEMEKGKRKNIIYWDYFHASIQKANMTCTSKKKPNRWKENKAFTFIRMKTWAERNICHLFGFYTCWA